LGFVGEGDFASAEATDAAVGSRKLLKKFDQNLKKGNGLGYLSIF
jgi:hypothetical protein